jgi:predicted metal-binding protein
LAASTEEKAIELGFENSQAFAGNSCKQLFCSGYAQCRVVFQDGKCRNPHLARPSMSGYGIDVSALMQKAGWNIKGKIENAQEFIPICGLVLVG